MVSWTSVWNTVITPFDILFLELRLARKIHEEAISDIYELATKYNGNLNYCIQEDILEHWSNYVESLTWPSKVCFSASNGYYLKMQANEDEILEAGEPFINVRRNGSTISYSTLDLVWDSYYYIIGSNFRFEGQVKWSSPRSSYRSIHTIGRVRVSKQVILAADCLEYLAISFNLFGSIRECCTKLLIALHCWTC